MRWHEYMFERRILVCRCINRATIKQAIKYNDNRLNWSDSSITVHISHGRYIPLYNLAYHDQEDRVPKIVGRLCSVNRATIKQANKYIENHRNWSYSNVTAYISHGRSIPVYSLSYYDQEDWVPKIVGELCFCFHL